MKRNNGKWLDLLIIIGMLLLVYLLCQPLGRSWDEKTAALYTGTEGVYSMDADTYYYLRKAREFTENGFSSIRVFSSRSEDALITSIRTGERDFLPNLLSAVVAVIWYLLHFLGLKLSVYAIAIRFNGAILALCTIPVYLFLKKRIARPSAALGALLVALAPPYLKHSLYTFFDTDALIGLFAITLILSMYECILCETKRQKLVYGILSCVSSLLLFCTWKIFYVYVIIAVGTAAAALILMRLLFGKRLEKQPGLRIPLIFMGVQTLIAVVLGAGDVADTFLSNFGKPGETEVWPSASAYVGELTTPGLYEGKLFWDIFLTTGSDYISYFGGLLSFSFLIASVVLCVIELIGLLKARKKGADFTKLFLLGSIGCWFTGTVLMCFFGIRFMEFCIIPSALIVALGFEKVSAWLMSEERSITTKRICYLGLAVLVFSIFTLQYPVIACVSAGIIMVFGFFGSRLKKGYALVALSLASVILGSMEGAWLISSLGHPLFEKPMEDAMLWVRDNTPEDAVVINFWDFGYMYQYVAERRTVSDGGTYNGAFTYWLGTMMATDDIKLSAGIARMLQNSGLDAVEYAESISGSKSQASAMLKQLLVIPTKDARELLLSTYGYSSEQADKLLAYTHPASMPEMYFVTNYHLFRLSATLDYYKSWDFTGNTKANGITLLGQNSVEKPVDDEIVTVELWNKTGMKGWKVMLEASNGEVKAVLRSPEGILSEFPRVVYVKDSERVRDEVVTKPEEGHLLVSGEAVLLIEENGLLSVVVCEESLIDSALFRLYLFDGRDQTSFTKAYTAEIPESYSGEKSSVQRRIGTAMTRDFINNGISIWKVNFD